MSKDCSVNPWVRFSDYLKDADRVAGDVLLSGIHQPATHDEKFDQFYSSIADLVARHEGEYEKTDVDDCLTFQEHWCKMNASYMVGVAVGLRLHGLLRGER